MMYLQYKKLESHLSEEIVTVFGIRYSQILGESFFEMVWTILSDVSVIAFQTPVAVWSSFGVLSM